MGANNPISTDVLKVTLKKTNFTFDKLHTLIAEFESVINSRPLTYVSTEAH